MKQKTHFVGMAGLHGYMPNYVSNYDTYDDAVDYLASMHELGSRRKAELKRNGYIELNIHKYGNEYAEIEACNCDDPECHND